MILAAQQAGVLGHGVACHYVRAFGVQLASSGRRCPADQASGGKAFPPCDVCWGRMGAAYYAVDAVSWSFRVRLVRVP
jgi:hypothetical protein